MADYNIYIHSFSGDSSPTTPFQLRASGSGDSESSGGDSGSNGYGMVSKAAAFVTNPDTLIGQTMGKATSVVGKVLPFALLAAAFSITKKVVDLYVPYSASATGNYSFQMKYNNFWTVLHNVTHPFSTELERQQAALEIRKQNAKNEQERLLFGGTIYTSKYGRKL